MFEDLGIKVNAIVPEGGKIETLSKLPKAWFNLVPYREVGLMAAEYLKEKYDMPYVSRIPMGVVETNQMIKEIENIINKDIDISKSSVKWLGKKVTGSHEGNIAIKEGHLHFDDNTFTGGNIVIDMTTIECTDLV